MRPTFIFLLCEFADTDASPLLLNPVAKAIVAIEEFLMNFLLSILFIVNYHMVNCRLNLFNKTSM